MKQLKHLENTLATYVYNHYNICNIQIKTYATSKMKHMKHTLETHTVARSSMQWCIQMARAPLTNS
jgi:hypothetical protein